MDISVEYYEWVELVEDVARFTERRLTNLRVLRNLANTRDKLSNFPLVLNKLQQLYILWNSMLCGKHKHKQINAMQP